LAKTNCCQPVHFDGFVAPLQAAGAGNPLFVLSWSENELLMPLPESVSLPQPVSPVVALLNDPVALDIFGPDALADQSLPSPPPTLNGINGAFAQGTSCHSVFGYEALKHPFFGKRTRAMDFRQACHFAACAAGGCVVASEEAATGAGSFESGACLAIDRESG
jgi:hypothetical protein